MKSDGGFCKIVGEGVDGNNGSVGIDWNGVGRISGDGWGVVVWCIVGYVYGVVWGC